MARSLGEELVTLRRDLHRHPEPSFQEVRTAGIAAEACRAEGFRVTTGIARTGVVAEIGGSGDGTGEPDGEPVVALRADMDALPITEENTHDHASRVPGWMHACGHDAHVAGLVGVARLLGTLAREGRLPPGRIRLLFQPSEEGMDDEGKSGARRMVEEGAMEGVRQVFGLHVGSHLPRGRVVLEPGPFFAGSDELFATVRGRSSHAARPHEGVDAVVLAAHVVTAAQQVVARRLSPTDTGVLTFGKIHGGTAQNIIADRVRLEGTLRYFDPAVRRRLREGVEGAMEVARALGGEAELTIRDGYPPLVNDPAATDRARRAAVEVLGPDALLRAEPTLGAEDFAYLAREAPGAFMWLGAALPDPREHHHPRFDIDDSVLPMASALLARMALLS
ncbi:MAG: amidohydrolase, partial [Gemmatimonadales bacterium]